MAWTEDAGRQVFGDDPADDRYRALWLYLRDSGFDDPVMADADAFRDFYERGGYPLTLIRLDPLANPDAVPWLRRLYGLPADGDWDAIEAAVQDDGTRVTLWDPVTDHTFLAVL
ncbi:hypothetical protein Sulac_3532 (plasmid) [Sulfobacillus acidophilus DSM 10332]|uniref:Uncharacterized protein n=1 Tax=Sulfobacillus acidophilus (strain ATCC 700253 / DSM 10332 / NAL) TaxID=679936 RepID=G8U1P0_SULAD|nr:hypothetical protein Sulac_3532 [Sulfobacillus acidophilus DSM 10332]